MDLSPIVHEYDLRCSPEEAFDVYTRRIGEWWNPDYTADPATYQTVTIEARAGGHVVTSHRGGAEDQWGQVTVWDPPHRLVHSSTLAQPPDQQSEISVRFTERAQGCHLRFEHGGWHQGNSGDRAKFSEWTLILDRFAALADAG